MRLFSRDVLVGFLLVTSVAASGCQPVQPIIEVSAGVTSALSPESEPVTGTATLSETVNVDSGATVAEQTPAVAATAAPTQVEDEAVDPALVEAGLLIYRAQYCGVCHTLDAAETRGVFGPPHNDVAAAAEGYLSSGQYHGPATTPAEYIRESIVDPQAFISPGFATTSHRMPSYAHLDDASIDALVALLLVQ